MVIKDLKEEHPRIYTLIKNRVLQQDKIFDEFISIKMSFSWHLTPEGGSFWLEIHGGNFTVFYEKYGKDIPIKPDEAINPPPKYDDLKNTSIWCEDEETFKTVQLRLLSMGLKWSSGGGDYKNYWHGSGRSIMILKNLRLFISDFSDVNHFTQIEPSKIGLEYIPIFSSTSFQPRYKLVNKHSTYASKYINDNVVGYDFKVGEDTTPTITTPTITTPTITTPTITTLSGTTTSGTTVGFFGTTPHEFIPSDTTLLKPRNKKKRFEFTPNPQISK